MAMDGMFDNETEHAILAGGIMALAFAGIGYAAVHNKRHRTETVLQDKRFLYLVGEMKQINDAVATKLPGYRATASRFPMPASFPWELVP